MKTKQLNDSSVGKRFIRRDYSIVRITKNTGDHFCDEFGRWYFRNGTVVKDAESQYDLMSEIEELPDFQRIDWERLRDCFEKASNGYVSSHLHVAVKEYNSTLPTALVPLPKEMPKDLTRFAMGHDVDEVWDKIISEYGTPANNLQPLPKATPYEFVGLFNESHSPRKIWEWLLSHYGTAEPKPNLPSYHDLFKELYQISVKTQSTILVSTLTKHIIKKYSLHPREWWQDLKEGDKFMYAGEAYEYYGYEVNIRGEVTLWGKSTWKFRLSHCTPYTPPTAQEIIAKHNLSEEEVRAIREGKCT